VGNLEKFVRENPLNEKFSDFEYVIDQLINSMEHYDEKSWVEHMSSETDIPPDILREIWKEWAELSGQVKGQNAYGWKKWLETLGLKEETNEKSIEKDIRQKTLDEITSRSGEVQYIDPEDAAETITRTLDNLEIALKGVRDPARWAEKYGRSLPGFINAVEQITQSLGRM